MLQMDYFLILIKASPYIFFKLACMSFRDRVRTGPHCRLSTRHEEVRFLPSLLPTSFELVRIQLSPLLRNPLPALRGLVCRFCKVLLVEFRFRRKRKINLKP
jgi:hypothetical protein